MTEPYRTPEDVGRAMKASNDQNTVLHQILIEAAERLAARKAAQEATA